MVRLRESEERSALSKSISKTDQESAVSLCDENQIIL